MALPNTYYRLDYIIFSGSQKIDTGTDLAMSHEHYKMKFYPTSAGERYIFYHNKYPQPYSSLSFMSSNKLTYTVAYQASVNVGDYSTMNMWYEVEYTSHSVSSSTFVVNGDSYDLTYGSRTLDSASSNCEIGRSYEGRLEYFKVYDQDTLIRNFIPAMRKSDSVVGMYDLVNDVFYTNAGTGTFTYGSIIYHVSATANPEGSGTFTGTGDYASGTDVTLTATPNSGYKFTKWELDGYTRLDYTQSNGTQYIDTKISFTANPTNKTGLEIKFNPQVVSGQTCLCGCENNGNTWNFAMQFYNGVIRTYHGSLESWQPVSITANQDYTLSIFQENGTLTRTLNDTTVTASTGMSIPSRTFTLFADSTTNLGYNQFSSLKIYYCKIYDNGVLIRDYIPAIRHSDMAIGLFDLVNMKFYGSNGTYPFNGGAL